jgi:acyl-CoA dehydrogenase
MLEAICASGAALSGASPIHFAVFPPMPIIKHGSDELRARVLPAIARGTLSLAFGVTEPNAGSDTSRIQTRAGRAGGGWVITGRKVWTSNARHSQKMLLLARSTPYEEVGPRKLDGLTLFVADIDPTAVTIREIDKLGRAAVDSNEVVIDGLRVADRDVVGEVGRGFYHLLDSLNPERILVAAEAVGIGRVALERAVAYARERVVFGRPIGQNQAVAHPLATAWAQLEAAWGLTLRAAWLFDHGQPCGAEANAAKVLAAEAGFEACDAALQTFGGFGYAKEFDVERLWREVRLYKIAPVSQQMALNYLAERVLGLPKSY